MKRGLYFSIFIVVIVLGIFAIANFMPIKLEETAFREL